jgi:hypothetical protein
MGSARKDMKAILEIIEAQGFTIVKSRGTSHFKVMIPGSWPISIPGTPGEGRSWQNTIAELRRAGINIPRKA